MFRPLLCDGREPNRFGYRYDIAYPSVWSWRRNTVAEDLDTESRMLPAAPALAAPYQYPGAGRRRQPSTARRALK